MKDIIPAKKESPILGLSGMGGGVGSNLGGSAGSGEYIDNIFSTYLWRGTGSAITVNNGLDLSGEGGMVWVKKRDGGSDHNIVDTARGVSAGRLRANNASTESGTNYVASITSTGFVTGTDSDVTSSANKFVSYSFRKAPGFFDVITYTGNGVAGRTVDHNLGSVPGMVIIKIRDNIQQNWVVYHRSLGNTGALLFDDNGAITTSSSYWNNTSPTSTNFTVGTDNMMNGTGYNYVAYVFAHNDETLGDKGNTDVIQCGGYTGNGSTSGPVINLGWEPQWVLIKRINAAEDWILVDSMRGLPTDGNDPEIRVNYTGAEQQVARNWLDVSPTGFQLKSTPPHSNGNGDTYMYCAIRRPDGNVGKPVETATSVFAMDDGNGVNTTPNFDSGFPVDFALLRQQSSTSTWYTAARLVGGQYQEINNHNAESTISTWTFDSNSGWQSNGNGGAWQSWMWKRHAGFDVTSYVGNGNAGHAVPHSMGAIPEMIWVKNRDRTGTDWMVYHKGLNGGTDPYNKAILINHTDGEVNNNSHYGAAPTATDFTVGTSGSTNYNNDYMQAILFASVPGISKVGSYTGSGNNITIDLGFTPRFFLCKARVQSQATFWATFDSVRGISSGTTPRLSLNTTAPQDNGTYVSTTSTGITLNNGYYYQNESGYEYIYYAHA
tara:strand:- start:23 stop:2008 length:1986 start_codon:yes stop_codon:yes gene_type:complete